MKTEIWSSAAEQSVLGAVILDESCLHHVVQTLPSDEFFYDPLNKRIYSTILKMFAENKKIDYVTVLNKVSSEKEIDKSILKNYMLDLVKVVPSINASKDYAKIIESKFKARKLEQVLTLSLEKIRHREDAVEVLGFVNQGISEITLGDYSKPAVTFQEASFEVIRQDDDILKTGIKELDEKLKIHKSDLVFVAGRPGMGKTSFALNVANNVAKDHKVYIFSLEMSSTQMASRIFDIESAPRGKLNYKLPTPEFWSNVTETCESLADSKMFIDDYSGITVEEMKAKAKILGDVDLIIIDYLQLITSPSYKESRNNAVAEITRQLKVMAKVLNVPVICLSQLSRACEQRSSHRPILADLRDSGSIEQDADSVLMLYRPYYYDETEKTDPNECECIIAKNRYGELGTVKLNWEPQCTAFREYKVS